LVPIQISSKRFGVDVQPLPEIFGLGNVPPVQSSGMSNRAASSAEFSFIQYTNGLTGRLPSEIRPALSGANSADPAWIGPPRARSFAGEKLFSLLRGVNMRSCFLMLLTVAIPSGAIAKDDAQADAERLQGIWQAVSALDSGTKAPDEALKNIRWTVTKDKIIYKVGDKTMEWSYKLDQSKKPKWIDLKEGNRTTLGIYELEGDTLKICFAKQNDERSTAFESKPDSVNDFLITFNREQP
jgi:uncharacterized protein (TIGR03067 family)